MAILLVFACKGKPGKEPEQGLGKDSVVLVSDGVLNSNSSDTAQFKGPSTEYGIFGFRNIEVLIQSFYYYDENHDDYWKGYFILLRDPAKKVADTLMLQSEGSSMENVEVEDMSDSLKFKSLVLKVSYSGSSDMPIDEFIEYKDGSLENLFTIEYLRELRRIGEHTLKAVIRGRDEVLYWGYDYPVTVDLLDHSVSGDLPDTQVIKHATITLEPVTVYKVRGEKLLGSYKLKTGTHLFIDTFFRKTGLVRMLLPDSTPVYIKEEDLRQKVEANNAG